MKKNYTTLGYVIASLALLFIAFSVGTYVGYSNRPEIEKVISVSNKEPQVETTADFNTFWKVWNLLNEKSIHANKASDQERVYGAIRGLASSLGDPYTVFFPPEENKLFNAEIHGSFGGIGAEIAVKEDVPTVVAPLKDSPAWNAGLKSGDKILRIDNTDTNNMTVDRAISLIRGKQGTVVTLLVLRPGERETREFKVTRGEIVIPTIDTEFREDNIFVIRLYSFSQNSDKLFKEALDQFIKSGSNKLVLDLRGNPGGYLDSAIDIASWFIDSGKVIVSEDFGDKREAQVFRSHGPRLFTKDLNFVVLVDGGSASASEILAGALREHGVATLIGEKTFGKGSVQELISVTDDTSLKVTIANWLTPNGTSISTSGLEPDIKVPLTLKDFDAKRDPQMDKAIEFLNKKQ